MKYAFSFFCLFAQVLTLRSQTTDTLLTTKLAENIYLFEPTTQCKDIVDGNTLAVIGKDGILIVDAMQRFRLTNEMLRKLGKISPLPVKYIVNTHWHGDHTFGNNIIKKLYPSCITIAHANMRQELDSAMLPIVDDLKSGYKESIAQIDNILKKGQYSNGRPVSGYERGRLQTAIADAQILVKDMQDFEYSRILPDIGFTDSMSIDLGNERITLLALPHAHSTTDIMAWIPSGKILATGDIVVNPAPYAIESVHSNWKKALTQITEINPAVIVPGHGAAEYDLNYVHKLQALLDEVDQKTRAAWKKGISFKDLLAKVDMAATQKSFTGGEPEKDYAFRQFFLAQAVLTIKAELDGKK